MVMGQDHETGSPDQIYAWLRKVSPNQVTSHQENTEFLSTQNPLKSNRKKTSPYSRDS